MDIPTPRRASRIYSFAVLRDFGNLAGVHSVAIESSVILAVAPIRLCHNGTNILWSATSQKLGLELGRVSSPLGRLSREPEGGDPWFKGVGDPVKYRRGVDGKPKQRHIAYLGFPESALAYPAQQRFLWDRIEDRLN